MTLILVLLVLMLMIGAVLGWVAFFRINALNRQIELLRKTVRHAVARMDTLNRELGRAPMSSEPARREELQESIETPLETPAPAPVTPPPFNPGGEAGKSGVSREPDVWPGEEPQSTINPARLSRSTAPHTRTMQPRSRPAGAKVFASIRDQWMIWLGGISISLAGIFLVRYSIEQGLLGPAARVTLGCLVGLGLHGAAEWFRRRNAGHYNAFAALAGGASITLYAALLAALLLYDLLAPGVVFMLLAIVSLATMALALLHGPVLAILGILGAYIVPMLVDTGSDSIVGLFIYSLIITTAALLLMVRVYRHWLWAGMLAGSLGWWFLSLMASDGDGYRSFYLFALTWLILALPARDWLLSKTDTTLRPAETTDRSPSIKQAPIHITLALLLAAFGFNVFLEPDVSKAIFYWTPLVVLFCLVGGSRYSLRWVPPVSLPLQAGAWMCRGLGDTAGVSLSGLSVADQTSFLAYAGWMTLLHVVLSVYNYRQVRRDGLWVVMLVTAPLLWLTLSYLLVSDLSESLSWGALAIALGVSYLGAAWWQLRSRKPGTTDQEASAELADTWIVWLLLGGHFAYSLAAAIMVREAGLTMALAAQLVSLAWVKSRFNRPELDLLVKVVVTVIVVRLTLNPWLLTYPADIHWSLWTYGGATLLAGIACRLLKPGEPLRPWLEAASLHLLVLTLWTETRYWLYDGNVFAARFELLEVAINTAAWSALALVYHLRYQVSSTFKAWYRGASILLLILAASGYLLMLLPLNPLWGAQNISTMPVFNELLLAFGFPVLMAMLLYRYHEPALRHWFGYFVCASGLIFVTLEIRHLWQGDLYVGLTTGNGELYTYTIVWMLFAIGALLAGSMKLGKSVYRGGMMLLMVVVAKIFLIDMADLEGLLRVASFMGLGLSLLALAYLYQRFNLVPGRTERPDTA